MDWYIYNLSDNLPYSQMAFDFKLRSEAKALGLTLTEVGQQISDIFTGRLLEVFYQGAEDIEVKVRAKKNSRVNIADLYDSPIITPSGELVPLSSVVSFHSQQSFDALPHTDRRLTVNVLAEVDSALGNANDIFPNTS